MTPQQKQEIIDKLNLIYNRQLPVGRSVDLKFERLMDYYLRLGKVMRINMESLIDIDGRLNELTDRKNFRLRQGPEYLKKLKKYREDLDKKEKDQELLEELKK